MPTTKEKLMACDGIGAATADRLIHKFEDWSVICDVATSNRVMIAKMDGFGPERAAQIQEAIEDSDYYPPESGQQTFADW